MDECFSLELCGSAVLRRNADSRNERVRTAAARRAGHDPAVAEIYSRTDGNYTYAGTTAREQLVVAQRDATMRCLRAKGLLPPSIIAE